MAIPIPTVSIAFKWFSKSNFKLNFPRLLFNPKPTSSNPPPPPLKAAPPLAEVAFHHLDADGDGKISCDELRSYFASIGECITRDDVRRVIRDFDGNGDELLELQDFARLMEVQEEEEGEDLRRAFEMFEVEKGCGFIGPEGLQKMFRRLGYVKSSDECMAMIDVFDINGDGVIDYREFLKMMARPNLTCE